MVSALDFFITTIEGSTATLTCVVAAGDPDPIFSWFQNEILVPNSNTPRYRLASNGTMLIIEPVLDSDDGQYMCMGTNQAGSDQDTITLEVIG